jgi:hypothetical protein
MRSGGLLGCLGSNWALDGETEEGMRAVMMPLRLPILEMSPQALCRSHFLPEDLWFTLHSSNHIFLIILIFRLGEPAKG